MILTILGYVPGIIHAPVMVFTWLIFWGWIWGIPGALLAIPLLAMTKIVADKIETLAPLGAFLGR